MSDRPDEWPGAETEAWPEAAAERLFGAYVIVGLSYFRADGTLDRQEQIHGEITDLDQKRGIRIALKGAHEGEFYDLPPVLSWFQAAPAGVYRLRSTGEEITDPDFTTTWTVNEPPSDYLD